MDSEATTAPVVTESPSIPWLGVRRVLGDWIGPGPLLEVLAREHPAGHDWARRDLRLRAHWLQFLRQRDRIRALPRTRGGWADALPAVIRRRKAVASAPGSSTDWVSTRIRHRWPPRAFETTEREKKQARLLAELGGWAGAHLKALTTAAERVEIGSTDDVRGRIDALASSFPSNAEITRRHADVGESVGYPWNALAAIWRDQVAPLEELALGLVAPDEHYQAALFHVGVLGSLLAQLEADDAWFRSVRPLVHAASPGPTYRGVVSGRAMEVWFEGGGIWSAAGRSSAYERLRSELPVGNAPMSPDIVCMLDDGRALAVECKYSTRPEYAIRDGFHQASTYAVELLEVCSDVLSLVAVPDEVLAGASSVVELSGSRARVGVCGASDVGAIASAFVTSTSTLEAV